MRHTNDIEEQSFQGECLHVQNSHLCTLTLFQKKETKPNQSKLHEIFPNVVIALNIFLSIAFTNCSAKRDFSVLKRIKNYFRANLIQEKLNSLGTLCIEIDLLNSINFDDIIDKFAQTKNRKKLCNIIINIGLYCK